MQVIRQFYKIEGNTVTIHLPDDFMIQKEVEIIVLPIENSDSSLGFWEALQQFRQENDLSDFEEDIFSQVRDKSIGREVAF